MIKLYELFQTLRRTPDSLSLKPKEDVYDKVQKYLDFREINPALAKESLQQALCRFNRDAIVSVLSIRGTCQQNKIALDDIEKIEESMPRLTRFRYQTKEFARFAVGELLR